MDRLRIAIAVAVLVVGAGCSVDTELGGVTLPNAQPDTRITGRPPTLLEAGFVVEFNWTGSDPDGRVAGYQWKISDNGVDGISPRDTLTVDPLTGAVMNPWHFTTSTDTVFYVFADLPDFPRDEINPRSFRTHSLFVRAVDDKGEVDPSPAVMSFTSTTLVPTAKARFPGTTLTYPARAPRTVNVGYDGSDPDFIDGVPTQVRVLMKRAIWNGQDIRLPVEYNAHYEELIDFDDPDWSPWQRYSSSAADRIVSYPLREPGTYWLFAVQTQDTAGAVSVNRRYAFEVAHLTIMQPGVLLPTVRLDEVFLGESTADVLAPIPIAAGQPLNFSWTASASGYNGKIQYYRHGWDIVDEANDSDPGWAVPPGLAAQNLVATERSFDQGTHTFTLQVQDDSSQLITLRRTLDVVPFVDYGEQAELLVIDQILDSNFQNWQDPQGIPRNLATYRNEWWSFLQSQPGGVNGLDWNLDRYNDDKEVHYADLVGYKAVLIYAQAHLNQATMFNMFKPEDGVDRFVWLTPYQERGGNLFLVGGGSMDSFLEPITNYMTPIIFDTREEQATFSGRTFTVGFGTKELPDGTEVDRGPLQYPYQVAGISSLDWTGSSTKYVYARPLSSGASQRVADCAGLKKITLDPSFRAHWLIGPGAVADTIRTEANIDWQDDFYLQQGTLGLIHNTFPYRVDEFVDANITSRTTQFTAQTCEHDANAPGGLCIEPMWRGIARFDWLRETKRSLGDPGWPEGSYTAAALDQLCGPAALTSYENLLRGSARTNGKVYGYLSYKMTADKPSRAPDVYWGFDPYRFDHTEARKAVRWVLKDVFGLDVLDE